MIGVHVLLLTLVADHVPIGHRRVALTVKQSSITCSAINRRQAPDMGIFDCTWFGSAWFVRSLSY